MAILDAARTDTDADAVLDMIRHALRTGGCLHGHDDDHPQTPPMLYPEWIACAVAQGRAEAEARHDAAVLEASTAWVEECAKARAEQREAIDKLERDIWALTRGEVQTLLLDRLAAIRAQETGR